MNNKMLALAMIVVAGLGVVSIVVVRADYAPSAQQYQGAESQEESYGPNWENPSQYGWEPQQPYAPSLTSSAGYAPSASTQSGGLTSASHPALYSSGGYAPSAPTAPSYGLTSTAHTTGLSSAPAALALDFNNAFYINAVSPSPSLDNATEIGIMEAAMKSVPTQSLSLASVQVSQNKTVNGDTITVTGPAYPGWTLFFSFELTGPHGSASHIIIVPAGQKAVFTFGLDGKVVGAPQTASLF